MKVQFFTQNNKIVGHATGGSTEMSGCQKTIYEITETDFKKIENWDWIPSFNNDKLVLTKSQV